MKYETQQPNEGDRSTTLEVKSEPPNGSSRHQPDRLRGGTQTPTFFVPDQTDASTSTQSESSESSHGSTPAPEKKLTLFALRLAVLEKTASGLGTLAFIWATVVLLGGFASDLAKADFYVVTTILLIEGTRIFSRSNELKWQHHATSTLAGAGQYSFRAIKAAFRPFSVFQTENISIILYWLQTISATACVVLSLMRLIEQDYGDNISNNQKPALDIFYGLALAEALLFLLERAYRVLKVSYAKLLDDVRRQCKLDSTGEVAIKRFFYDAYSKCINASIFDGVKMDLLTFSEELLDSDFHDEQLIGARLLRQFVKSKEFAPETIRKIGTSTRVMERLIEMLNWKNPTEAEIRQCAAEIVSKVVKKNQNALRIAGIPGSMESISSLLHTWPVADHDQADYQFSVFHELGQLILKKLAVDHDNCGKMGNARGLLSKIIDFTCASPDLLRNDRAPKTQLKAVKTSLQVVKILASATGNTGKMLRQKISETVFTVSNIRDILQYGHIALQKLGIEALTGLAMDENAKETIGTTGGVIKLLLVILLRRRSTEDENSVSAEAGEALAMLALENRENCHRISKEKVALKWLISVALTDPVLQLNASRILRNLCAYSEIGHTDRLWGVTAAIPIVLKTVMEEKGRLLEVSIGLTTQICCKFMDPQKFAKALEQADIEEKEAIVKRLVQKLKEYDHPSIQVPRIRRFVIEQATWMVRYDRNYIQLFKNLEMEKLLEGVADTTTELECFHVFSGSVGLSKHSRTLSSLVDTALDLMLDS